MWPAPRRADPKSRRGPRFLIESGIDYAALAKRPPFRGTSDEAVDQRDCAVSDRAERAPFGIVFIDATALRWSHASLPDPSRYRCDGS